MSWLLLALWLAVTASQPLTAQWQGNVLVIAVDGPGCLMAMPGNTGTGLCDFSGQPWIARIGRFGDYATAAGVAGRSYELESGGRRVASVDVPTYATVWLPDVASP